MEVFTCFARSKNLRVLRDSSREEDFVVMVAMMAVYVFPPKESWSSRVSFDSRKGRALLF